jgi:hypothetical protein
VRAVIVGLALVLGCKSKREPTPDEPVPSPIATDARPAIDAAKPWPELDGYPRIAPARVIAVPAKPDVPRLDVGGPVIAGEVAVVSSSQFGFAAIDWRRGTVVWTKPAGERVAPPLVINDEVVLIGDCANPPQIPSGEQLVGCLRIVTPTGTDVAYSAIRGKPAALESFAGARGAQHVWREGERAVRWRRGDAALRIDLISGVAKPADPTPPPLVVEHAGRRWSIAHADGRIIATGKPPWATKNAYTAVLGAVWLPEQSPMLRVANTGAFRNAPEIHVIDIDATGSLRGQVARPAPGIALLGWGVSSIGDAAIAVRLDNSLQRDYIVGYAANALMMWVYPLPEVPRPDPVGVAIAPDAVVVFHDGDTLTVLPELSAPPTTPGAARAPSKNPTP